MATSITMETSTTAGKKSTRSITDVNPDATNADIKNFVTGLNALTTNTLESVNRVDKTKIDTDKTYTPVTMQLVDGQNHLTADGLTITYDNQETVDEAAVWIYCGGTTDSHRIKINSFEWLAAETRADRFFIGYIKNTPKDESTRPTTWGLSVAAYKDDEAPAATQKIRIPGGSVTVDSNTYYYDTFEITLVQLAAE